MGQVRLPMVFCFRNGLETGLLELGKLSKKRRSWAVSQVFWHVYPVGQQGRLQDLGAGDNLKWK